VYALAASGSDFISGGAFTKAGGKVSHGVAKAIMVEPPVLIITTNSSFGISNGLFGFNLSGSSGQTLVIEGSTNLLDWMPLQTNALDGSPVYFSDPQWMNYPGRFYRLRSQ
jgi:hypothetical protein